jgi:hypothetical protein
MPDNSFHMQVLFRAEKIEGPVAQFTKISIQFQIFQKQSVQVLIKLILHNQ